MKKLLASLVVFSFLLVGCGGSSSEEFEVALVTDAGDINDKSFNQSAWEAVEQYQKIMMQLSNTINQQVLMMLATNHKLKKL